MPSARASTDRVNSSREPVAALRDMIHGTSLFDVSFALGAFFAGMVLNESELSHRAAHDTLPLRDAFAVLFFVSVGMIFPAG